ncbi:MAG: hypothetical protein AAFY64_03685 [Pseudomonadota bacterium]
MRYVPSRLAPGGDRRLASAPLLPVIIVTAFAFAVSACATHSYDRSMAGAADVYTADGNPQPEPAGMARPRRPHTPEIEADGLPVQTAPFRRHVKEADDPSEPFSPNYGADPKSNPTQHRAPTRREAHIDAEPRIVRSRVLSFREGNAVMAAAISAHEQRNP